METNMMEKKIVVFLKCKKQLDLPRNLQLDQHSQWGQSFYEVESDILYNFVQFHKVFSKDSVFSNIFWDIFREIKGSTDYRRQVRKSPSLHGQKSTPNLKFLGTAEAYFVCDIGPNFQISLIYFFIGCP